MPDDGDGLGVVPGHGRLHGGKNGRCGAGVRSCEAAVYFDARGDTGEERCVEGFEEEVGVDEVGGAVGVV